MEDPNGTLEITCNTLQLPSTYKYQIVGWVSQSPIPMLLSTLTDMSM